MLVRVDANSLHVSASANYFGMIDQLVASRGKIFFGCWFSTFTGYINRIRGYHSVKDKLPGYKSGELPTTYYYATIPKKFEMHKVRHSSGVFRFYWSLCMLLSVVFFATFHLKYKPLNAGFFNREFPTSWRDIDKGIQALADRDTKES